MSQGTKVNAAEMLKELRPWQADDAASIFAADMVEEIIAKLEHALKARWGEPDYESISLHLDGVRVELDDALRTLEVVR